MLHDFPELTATHLAANARLFANREDMVRSLPIPRGRVIAEVGVALGNFSQFLIENLRPKEFHAFDLFEIHRDEKLWGRPTAEVLEGKTHSAFYHDRMTSSDAKIVIHEGLSKDTLPKCPDASFDVIYVDAAHTYDEVREDAHIAVEKIKPNGILIFNDYIMHDPFIRADYGIVPVVNELVANHGWKVLGFALQKHMFCDIAIIRPGISLWDRIRRRR